MNTNSTMIKTSFSIENILSKPDKRPKPSEPIESELRTDPVLRSTETDAGRGIHNEQVHNEENNNRFSEKNDNGFTTPDSSCCDEENADTLSDITSEESCKFQTWKITLGNRSTRKRLSNCSSLAHVSFGMSINRLNNTLERSSTMANCFFSQSKIHCVKLYRFGYDFSVQTDQMQNGSDLLCRRGDRLSDFQFLIHAFSSLRALGIFSFHWLNEHLIGMLKDTLFGVIHHWKCIYCFSPLEKNSSRQVILAHF